MADPTARTPTRVNFRETQQPPTIVKLFILKFLTIETDGVAVYIIQYNHLIEDVVLN